LIGHLQIQFGVNQRVTLALASFYTIIGDFLCAIGQELTHRKLPKKTDKWQRFLIDAALSSIDHSEIALWINSNYQATMYVDNHCAFSVIPFLHSTPEDSAFVSVSPKRAWQTLKRDLDEFNLRLPFIDQRYLLMC
jgi:hypothetical protein